jgi:dTDP-4-dehydrorhamnose reductase
MGTLAAPDRVTLNLTAPSSISSALDDLRPELIVNCAAYTAVDRAEDERDEAFSVNAESPAAMAAWASERSVPIIHLSTDYVFDGNGERPWSEDDVPRPWSVYGRSKLQGEEAIRRAGAPHLILRTSWVYAAHGKNFLRTIAAVAVSKPELSVVADQVGAPTSAETIASATAHVIERYGGRLTDAFARAGGVCHLAAQGTTSWHGFASAIVDGLRCRGRTLACRAINAISSSDYPTKARRPHNSRLSLERASEVFGLRTPHWHVALEHELDVLVGSSLGRED